MPKQRRIALLFDPGVGYCRGVLGGIQNAAREHPSWIFHDAIGTMSNLKALVAWKPHGVLAHLFDRQMGVALGNLNIPLVNTTSTLLDLGLPLVEIDHRLVGEMAAQFFLERGYERFGFFGSSWTHFSKAREEAFVASLSREGRTCTSCYQELLPRRANSSWDQIAAKTRLWLRRLLKPCRRVAVFASNDAPARHLARICNQMGIAVPGELSLLSVDNDLFECRLANPRLSSIEIPALEVGERAAQLLDRLMKGEPAPREPVWLPPVRVVRRGSTDAHAFDDPELQAFFDWLERGYALIGASGDLVAKQLGLGRRTLERKLSSRLKTTINREIRKRRIAEAKARLVTSGDQIARVAKECGFASPERFAVVFRQEESVSPKEYRAQHRPAE